MTRFNGYTLQKRIALGLKHAVESLPQPPTLTILQIGNHPASSMYVKRKQEFGQTIGCKVNIIHLPEQASQTDAEMAIRKQNDDPAVNGIIVQLPMPEHLSNDLLQLIDPKKDVDGLGKDSPFTPATPLAIMEILDDQKIDIAGKHTVVVGRSALVGGPVTRLMQERGARVTVCHSKSGDLTPFTTQADILIVAVGKPNLVTPAMVKAGSVVVNVGGTLGADGQLHGDVDPEAADKASLFTPVPGGVGPVTVGMLFTNLVAAAKEQTSSVKTTFSG
ncbi:MAG: bifunctional 5,10-methylenetetrahydrofolate dehydrogenase/5,10-methenyltetrahydrofolate cyclohydrolase [bacterium]|nr:bifunctional 5,10-methylenetetrahydrofolate dehydrogenase/5,10-methenyltetrahydrofolate cyclohydrolase [bacterium]